MLNVYSISCGRPEFIKFQYESLRKFVTEPFAFTVFNNTMPSTGDSDLHYEVLRTCLALELPCIDVKLQDLESYERFDPNPVARNGRYQFANIANAYPLCWAWKDLISSSPDHVLLLDSDMFLTRPLDTVGLLIDHDICFVPQHREHLEYAWIGFVLANMRALPAPQSINWYCGKVDGVSVDVGGQTAAYLREHPGLRVLRILTHEIENEAERLWIGERDIALHYRCGSDWNLRGAEYHQRKAEWLKTQLA